MRQNTAIILIIILLVLGGFYFWQNNQAKVQNIEVENPFPSGTSADSESINPNASLPDSPVADPNTVVTPKTPVSAGQAVKSFTVSGENFSFTPKSLTVNKGDTVRITFKNANGMHNFIIDEFGVATKTIAGGQSETVEFTANKAGSFEYYCSVGSHRANGMWGTLIVK